MLLVEGQVVVGEDALAGGAAETFAKGLVMGEGGEGVGEGVGVSGCDEKAVLAGADELWDAGDGGADAGQAERHGLHEGDGDAFGEAGEGEEVGFAEEFEGFRVGEGLGEGDGVAEIVGKDVVLEGLELGAAADEGGVDGGAALAEEIERLEEDVVALGGDEAAGADEFQARRRLAAEGV